MKNKIQKALDTFNLNKFDECEKICLSLLEDEGEDAIVLNLLGIINSNNGNIDLAISYFERGTEKDPKSYISFFNLGKLYYQIDEKEKSYKSFNNTIGIKKDFIPAYQNILTILIDLNKLKEAQNLIDEISLKNMAFNNLSFYEGKIFLSKGDIDKAYDCFTQVIENDPLDYQGYSFLGRLSLIKNNLDESIYYYKKAIEIKKQSEDLINISICFSLSGKIDEAEKYIKDAHELFPNEILTYLHWATLLIKKDMLMDACLKCYEGLERYNSLSIEIQKKEESTKQNIEKKLMDVIEKISIDPKTNYDNHPDLLRKNYEFFEKVLSNDGPLDILVLKNTAQNTLMNMIEKNYPENKFDKEILSEIISIKSLNNFISKIANTNIIIEDFLTKARSFIIRMIAEEDYNEIDKNFEYTVLKNFIGSIAIQCHHNEYIWNLNEEDSINIDKIVKSLNNHNQTNQAEIEVLVLTLTTVKSLKDFKEIIPNFNVLKNTQDEKLLKIFNYQISDPQKEGEIKKTIKNLGKIKNLTSKKVQKQYESSPYPRWDNMPVNKHDHYNYIVQTEISPNTFIYEKEKTKILIAGCGTGRHAINVAMSSQRSKVTALDLSADSLAYGIRKANEMGISNIEWFQGDILEVEKFDYNFDYIESSGVLHHMENPSKGFEALMKKLEPNGLMKIGLYSSSSKRRLNNLKEYIKNNNIKRNKKDIDKLRNYIKNSDDEDCLFLKKHIADFFITSEIIDLLLHEQEVFFTIPDLKKLFKNEFNFLGFIFENREKKYYQSQFPNDRNHTNLDNWEIIESKNPDFFRRMYQFWLQKKNEIN